MNPKYILGDIVRKTKGASWKGTIVGTYCTALTPEGYCVESLSEVGSVQIYPASALELVAYKPFKPCEGNNPAPHPDGGRDSK